MFGLSNKKEKKQPEENNDKKTEKDQKEIDYGEQAEKENKFYTMPTKESVSHVAGGSNSKLMGIIIMVCGIIVLGGAVYFSYIYLIAPQSQPQQMAEEKQNSDQATQQQNEQEKDDLNNQTEDKKETSTEEDSQENEKSNESETATAKDQDNNKTASTTKEEAGDEEETASTTKKLTEEKEEQEATSTQVTVEDEDGDGLSLAEENIFGADPKESDTDEDGFRDGSEVMNLYDPAQAKVSLIENDNIEKYTNQDFGYSLLYPAEWDVKEVGGNTSLMFKSPGKEFIQLIIQDNTDSLGIEEWYSQQFPEEKMSEENVVELETWKGIKKKNRSIYYLTDSDKKNIYVISYSAPADITPQYGTIFNMMVKSFSVE
jgi:hypothetical protein